MMRKQYSAAFKAKVVQELLKEEKTLAQIASVYEVHPTQLKNWRAVALEGLPGLFEKQDSTAALQATHERQITELYAEIGKLTTQVTWLKKTVEAKVPTEQEWYTGENHGVNHLTWRERTWKRQENSSPSQNAFTGPNR
jgi:transposase-like protein